MPLAESHTNLVMMIPLIFSDVSWSPQFKNQRFSQYFSIFSDHVSVSGIFFGSPKYAGPVTRLGALVRERVAGRKALWIDGV